MLRSDSCKVAIQELTNATEWNAELRTGSGSVEALDWSGAVPANEITIPSTGSVSISDGPKYFAMKITKGTGSNAKTYYGYLRLKVFGSIPSDFEKVEFSFKYGEARDYTKE
jgi:hypothetical protein